MMIEFSKGCYSFLLDFSLYVRRINTARPTQSNPYITEAISYLEENYYRNLSLDEIAEHAGLSKEYLWTLFKKTMQQTVMHVLTTIRISHAHIFLMQYPQCRDLLIKPVVFTHMACYYVNIKEASYRES